MELVIRYGHMYLCRGWEQFYRAYDLRHGYFFLFRYDGDAMLTVKVFNTTMCRMRYQDEDDASTFCLFFLYILLCLTSIVNGHCCIWSGNGSSSSDSGCSKSNSEDDLEWSREEEEQSGDEEVQADDGQQMVVAEDDVAMMVADDGQEMVVAEDDLAMVLPEDDLAMVVVPDNDLTMVVAPAIPQPGDMTMPIVVEDYIPQPPPPRRSWRIKMRNEKEKKNEE